MFAIPAFLFPGIICMPLPPNLPHLVWGIGKAPPLGASCTKVEINSDSCTVPHSLLCWYNNETHFLFFSAKFWYILVGNSCSCRQDELTPYCPNWVITLCAPSLAQLWGCVRTFTDWSTPSSDSNSCVFLWFLSFAEGHHPNIFIFFIHGVQKLCNDHLDCNAAVSLLPQLPFPHPLQPDSLAVCCTIKK